MWMLPTRHQRPALFAVVALALGVVMFNRTDSEDAPDAQEPKPVAQAAAPTPPKPLSDDVALTAEVRQNDDGAFSFYGTTNLPDKAELMFTVSSPLPGDRSHIEGQTSTFVDAGTFQTEAFSKRGAPYDRGVYDFSISMSQANQQDAEVQTVVGDKGQHLKGPLVVTPRPDDMLVDYGPRVKLEKRLQVDASGTVRFEAGQ